MESDEIRKRFLEFFEKRGHKIVPSSSLIPTDPSVLLTTAGMQQFKPYFLGEPSPFGLNVASVQKCFRTSDLDSVGDESHLTFFEMLGNFSFGGYFKEEAIKSAADFLKELKLEIESVSVFGGDAELPEDKESAAVWQKLGIQDIRRAGRADNFWGPTGNAGPCGPTTEIYLRGTEIWNLVFNEYYCHPDGRLEPLKTPGVDTGMGLERLATVVQGAPTIFETDLFQPLMSLLPPDLAVRKKRIIADHCRGIVFLIADGLRPANKGSGYVLRRLIRRLSVYQPDFDFQPIIAAVVENYSRFYPELSDPTVAEVFEQEASVFKQILARGLRELNKIKKLDGRSAFSLYESYGLPFEILQEHEPSLRREEFEREFQRHQVISRTGVTAKFAGGLADHEPPTIRLHTAHHLLLGALKRVLGPEVKQRGSNITQERLRLDFTHPEKLSGEQRRQVEDLVNQKIKENIRVVRQEMSREEAEKIGAEMEFGQKYGEWVSVYFIEDDQGNVFSKEFCAGPHVARTGVLGRFRIIKEEAVGQGLRRLKAVLD